MNVITVLRCDCGKTFEPGPFHRDTLKCPDCGSTQLTRVQPDWHKEKYRTWCKEMEYTTSRLLEDQVTSEYRSGLATVAYPLAEGQHELEVQCPVCGLANRYIAQIKHTTPTAVEQANQKASGRARQVRKVCSGSVLVGVCFIVVGVCFFDALTRAWVVIMGVVALTLGVFALPSRLASTALRRLTGVQFTALAC
jgi:DNA-directed RNA polymerase subunit RPC12/RpoP/predicted lysophospholipase L1 biosynthesis ABC-type transport system permease subunit